VDGVRFASPWVLWLLLLAPPLAMLSLRARRRATARMGSLADARSRRPTWRTRGERVLPLLQVFAAVLLVVAIARPQRGVAGAETADEGIDIALAFDISASMTYPYARNETRLDAAKRVVSNFVSTRQGDRVGLVVFQATSLTLSPLTSDYQAVASEVRGADRVHLFDGTAIGLALAEAVKLLGSSSAASRIVILLTDGQNNVHVVEPLAAARVAEALGVRVYVIGVGGSGLPGEASFTVDEQAMRKIAEITGGAYNRAEDPAALQDTYDEIARLEQSRLPGTRFSRYDEWSPYLLASAAALLTLYVAARFAVFRRLA
jgi:Ca-activated chloride channel family protein